MGTQIPKSSIDIDILPNDFRKEIIVNFIRKKKRATRSEISRIENGKHFSRDTVDKLVLELLHDSAILELNRETNSRNKYLIINSENIFQKLKFELRDIQELFQKFTKELEDIYSQQYSKWPSHKHAPTVGILSPTYTSASPLERAPKFELNSYYSQQYMNFLVFQKRILNAVIQIPFAVIDVIFAPYKYLQKKYWNRLDENTLVNLNQLLFSYMNKLHLNASRMSNAIYKEPFNFDPLDARDEYFITFENAFEQYSILKRICILRHECKSIGLQDQLDTILNYLIDKNSEYFDKRYFFILKPHWENLGFPKRNKLEIIHENHCPAKKNKKDGNKCHLLDNDPTFPYF
ncbi:hypothetical protein [Candidatus Nitrosocosmicus hydrocola]|uniref:hypothetical protein n=1 Tax=Candidatus Nitrosocosmicus hydrocola TaxID=1826872 RepID=UPI0011E589C9|nr:hypothetical protein [Candidatus Nitrosocosmicus hydrocola]